VSCKDDGEVEIETDGVGSVGRVVVVVVDGDDVAAVV
jgi:hypothetical protein